MQIKFTIRSRDPTTRYLIPFDYGHSLGKRESDIGSSMRTYKPNRYSGPNEPLFETPVRN
jgi:hypothetical protein